MSNEITELNRYASEMQSITELIGNVSSELGKMVKVIEEMLQNAEEQNVVANNTAQCFTEIARKVDEETEEEEEKA